MHDNTDWLVVLEGLLLLSFEKVVQALRRTGHEIKNPFQRSKAFPPVWCLNGKSI